MLHAGFVYLDEAVPGILCDAKYATSDNFTGAPVDGYHSSRVVGTIELARALSVARDLAGEQHLKLLLWDAYRPQRAVQCFMAWCAQAEDNKTRARHYPNHCRDELIPLGYIAARSGHSRGSTVDLTLTNAAGTPLDMGGTFDFMDDRSHHGAPGLTEIQSSNRRKLLAIMRGAGFIEYENEWWHYRLMNEPYPDTYFDFPIE